MATHTTLQFLGGAQTVTGSKYLLTYKGRRILIDCGMFQGAKKLRDLNWSNFPLDPASIDTILLTHAHIDHCGYIPALVKRGFSGKIYATNPTIDLTEIVLRDAAFLQEQDAEDANRGGYSKHKQALPLFDMHDVEAALPLFKPFPIHKELDLGGGIHFEAVRAGHILGSVSYRLWLDDAASDQNEVIFSGDLGRVDHPVLADRETPRGAANVLIESTYGNREHPSADVQYQQLADAISRTIKRGGNVLIPAFAVDRTEVVLHVVSELTKQGKIPNQIPIWVNSPMGLRALDVYTNPKYQDEIGSEFRGGKFFDLPTLREARSKEDSIALNKPDTPSIIISSSGMATGGRVVHHLKNMLPDERNCVIFTGYQAAGTRGRLLVEGADQIKMYGQYVPVKAEIVHSGEFSVHADCSDLLDWLDALNPKPKIVYCVHGEKESTQALALKIKQRFGVMALAPKPGEIVRL